MGKDLEKVDKQSALSLLYNPPVGTKSIDVRRQMIEIPEVAESLSRIEKYIFNASTKLQLCDIDDSTLVAKMGKLFRYIAIDVGYNVPQDPNDWAYICSRLMTVITRYYSQLTLADIKLAFELLTTGEFDRFLPKDSKGNADRKHFQNFNVDYFTRILNAYKRRQNEVIGKAYKSLSYVNEMTPEQERYYHNRREERNKIVFLRYKYTGRISLELSDAMFLYNWLYRCGLADEVSVNKDDRKQAFAKYMHRAAIGMVNQYTAFRVRLKGTDSQEIDFTAYEVAREKEIIKAFDRMIEDELQIDNYLDFRE